MNLFQTQLGCAFSEAAFGEILASIRPSNPLQFMISFSQGFENPGKLLNMDQGSAR